MSDGAAQEERGRRFAALHEQGCFLIPNPWDAGTARVLESLGFEALATTSSGFAFTLGRGDGAQIRLEDPFASSRHARIYEQGNSVVVEDLHSTNGTYLNEELLQTPRPLHPGDRVRIGDSEFVFEVD